MTDVWINKCFLQINLLEYKVLDDTKSKETFCKSRPRSGGGGGQRVLAFSKKFEFFSGPFF